MLLNINHLAGFLAVTTVNIENEILGTNKPVFGSHSAATHLMETMLIEALVYMILVCVTELKVWRLLEGRWHSYKLRKHNEPPRRKGDSVASGEHKIVDSAVANESSLAAALYEKATMGMYTEVKTVEDPATFPLIVSNLQKVYPPTQTSQTPKYALRGLSLCLRAGDKFGFLGMNGAGKSTTMSVLTGDIEPTSGSALIAGRELADPLARLSIGYCPQSDPVSSLLILFT